MGTRNLTVIISDNEVKLSQYGQWDGYFSYTGEKFINFVREHLKGNKKTHEYLLKLFKEKVSTLGGVDQSYINMIKEKHEEFSADNHVKNKSDYAIPLNIMFPQFSRDTGVEILNIIQRNCEPFYMRGKKFPVYLDKDTSFVEFIYIINLDTDEIYMLTYHEFKGEPLTTCELVDKLFKMPCWYKSSIATLPTVKQIEKYKISIGLDYEVREDGEVYNN